MRMIIGLGVASVLVVVMALTGLGLLGAPTAGEHGPTVAPVELVAPVGQSPSMLPALHMPSYGAIGTPAREYGWTGTQGTRTGMHHVVAEAGDEFRQTQIVFAIESDCFARGEGPEPASATIVGFEALYVEPYTAPKSGPRVVFMIPAAGATTGAYQLAIGDRTLCVYLTWDAATTPAELDAARAVIASIRAQPYGPTGVRIVFIAAGWDNG